GKGFFTQCRNNNGDCTGRQNQTDAVTDLNATAVKGLFSFWRIFYGHECCTAPFTTDSKALQGPTKHQQYRCPPANRFKIWQQTNPDRGNSHQDYRKYQHFLAAELVTKVTKYHTT